MSEGAGAEDEDRGILDSVRRILAQSHAEDDQQKGDGLGGDGILRLDEAMMVDAEHRPVLDAEHRPVLDAEHRPVLDAEHRPAMNAEHRPVSPAPGAAAIPDVSRRATTDASRAAVADDPRREAVELANERDPVLGDEAARSAAHSLASLRATARHDAPRTHRGGPTIEEIVREEIRPMLRDWLDRSLPPLVEKLVRAEIARISGLDG